MFRLRHIMMMVVMSASIIQAEYFWTGKEWIWKESDNNNDYVEGSGDTYDDDYDLITTKNNDYEEDYGSGDRTTTTTSRHSIFIFLVLDY